MHLNDFVKVKLTDLGKEIYYHQYDDSLKEYPVLSKYIKPHYPKIDKDGYTKFMLWQFIQLYGNHIGMGAPNVIEPLEIIECEEKEWGK